MKKVLKSLFNLLLAIPVTLFGGFVFAHLWNWFVVRKFSNAPSLTMLDAVGLIMVASFPLFSLVVVDTKKDIKLENPKLNDVTVSIIVSVVMLVLVYPVMLGAGYLWHLVIGQ